MAKGEGRSCGEEGLGEKCGEGGYRRVRGN